MDALALGDCTDAFIRPEVAVIARQPSDLPDASHCSYLGKVESILFDGANSAVLLRERDTDLEFRIALPQNGRLHDLKKDELVHFGFDPQRAVCFARKGQDAR
jgi:spermidine/putrescine transport system ATP-binding protein